MKTASRARRWASRLNDNGQWATLACPVDQDGEKCSLPGESPHKIRPLSLQPLLHAHSHRLQQRACREAGHFTGGTAARGRGAAAGVAAAAAAAAPRPETASLLLVLVIVFGHPSVGHKHVDSGGRLAAARALGHGTLAAYEELLQADMLIQHIVWLVLAPHNLLGKQIAARGAEVWDCRAGFERAATRALCIGLQAGDKTLRVCVAGLTCQQLECLRHLGSRGSCRLLHACRGHDEVVDHVSSSTAAPCIRHAPPDGRHELPKFKHVVGSSCVLLADLAPLVQADVVDRSGAMGLCLLGMDPNCVHITVLQQTLT
eukprot:151325-Chlamydomonas_euryale.AAC.22